MKHVFNVIIPLVTVWCTACGAAGDMNEPLGEESEALVPQDRLPVTFDVLSGNWTIDTNRNGIRDSNEFVVNYGTKGDLPIIGSWGPDYGCFFDTPRSRLGIYRSSSNQFRLDTNDNKVLDANDRTITVLLDTTKFTSVYPFAWRVRRSVSFCYTVVGLFAKKAGTESVWHINADNDDFLFEGDQKFSFGSDEDFPAPIAVSHEFDAAMAAVYRSSQGTYFIDRNFSRNWNGCANDRCVQFGVAGSLPVTTGEQRFIGTTDGSSFFIDENGSFDWNGPPDDRIMPFTRPPGSIAMTGFF